MLPIILASGSPRRAELLCAAGLEFSVVQPPNGVEPAPAVGADPAEYAMHAALTKAAATSTYFFNASQKNNVSACTPHLVIGADTVVALNRCIFGKPRNAEEAYSFLSFLKGKTHDVFTGCALSWESNTYTFFSHSRVTFWDCPESLLKNYAFSEEVLDKAGAYAIQGRGIFLVSSLSGSLSNVIGLPIEKLLNVLLKKGFITAA